MTRRPGKVIGMHFFNRVPVMAPVEIVRGENTSEETVSTTRMLAEQMGKQALVVADSPGFVVNRILMPLINEAVFTLQEGVADAATIDSLMKLGCNHPMGPLQLADLVGLDVCLSILRVLHRELGDPKFRPCPLLVRMVDAGHLGRKTSKGFYTY
jgi:3-hydroxybutyryl-CoA dehydrogenase